MGWYSDECLQITDEFEFDHKKEVHWGLGINETVTDIWILNKKKECLLRMKNVYNGMRKEVQELENKYYGKLDKESKVEARKSRVVKWEESRELKIKDKDKLIDIFNKLEKRNSR